MYLDMKFREFAACVFNLHSSLSLTYEEIGPRRNAFCQQPATDHTASARREVLRCAGAAWAHTRLRTQQCESSAHTSMLCSHAFNIYCQ